MKYISKFKNVFLTLFLVLAMFFGIGCGAATGNDNKVQSNETGSVVAGDNSTVAGGNSATTGETVQDATHKPTEKDTGKATEKATEAVIDKAGSYYSKEDVALYIHTYNCLPSNFITKDEAKKLGWTGGSVEKYAKGKAIGGDYFGNYEGLLPKKSGRKYTECDIDTLGQSSRGAKRIIFSNDGLVYYTDDHYESFTLLYGEE